MRFVVLAALLSLTAAQPNPVASAQGLLTDHIRYVFVIYQENRSFDHYFGTFPGADGIYSDAARAHGFSQYNPVAQRETRAFRIVAPDVGLINNARTLVDAGIHGGAMDGFVAAQTAWAKSPSARRQSRARHDRPGRSRIGRRRGNGARGLRHDPLPLALREPLRALRLILPRRARAVGAEQRRDHRCAERRDGIQALWRCRPVVYARPSRHRRARRTNVCGSRPGVGTIQYQRLQQAAPSRSNLCQRAA